MIDVMKRLAELDAKNPQVVKENTSVQECGPMGMMGGMSDHHTPASINMTADSGSELTGMLRDIMQLAGMQQVGAQHLGVDHEPMSLTPEPISAVGPAIAEPMSGADDMRAVLDKLNPEMGDDEGDEGEKELGPFQGDSGEGDEGDDEREKADETVDSMPNDPTDAPPADANQYAHQENQPGSGNDSEGEKRQSNLPTATFESLMKEYKQFIGEAEDEDMEEGNKPDFLDMDKDGDKKEPMKKAAKEKEVDESAMDILKLAGLK